MAHLDFIVAPRPLANMKLVTDASLCGLGAVLLQWEGEDAEWLCGIRVLETKTSGIKAHGH
jgi:hypothetical protein